MHNLDNGLDIVKISAAAKVLGVSVKTLRRWEKSGKISAIRTPGGTRLYSLRKLQAILNPKDHTFDNADNDTQAHKTWTNIDKEELSSIMNIIKNKPATLSANQFSYPKFYPRYYHLSHGRALRYRSQTFIKANAIIGLILIFSGYLLLLTTVDIKHPISYSANTKILGSFTQEDTVPPKPKVLTGSGVIFKGTNYATIFHTEIKNNSKIEATSTANPGEALFITSNIDHTTFTVFISSDANQNIPFEWKIINE